MKLELIYTFNIFNIFKKKNIVIFFMTYLVVETEK